MFVSVHFEVTRICKTFKYVHLRFTIGPSKQAHTVHAHADQSTSVGLTAALTAKVVIAIATAYSHSFIEMCEGIGHSLDS